MPFASFNALCLSHPLLPLLPFTSFIALCLQYHLLPLLPHYAFYPFHLFSSHPGLLYHLLPFLLLFASITTLCFLYHPLPFLLSFTSITALCLHYTLCLLYYLCLFKHLMPLLLPFASITISCLIYHLLSPLPPLPLIPCCSVAMLDCSFESNLVQMAVTSIAFITFCPKSICISTC